MDARSVLQRTSVLPPRGSFSDQIGFTDASLILELPLSDDDDDGNAFEYLPDDRRGSSVRVPAPMPSPPPPPPPSPPTLPFRNTQRVRVKSESFPSQSTASRMQSSRRATTNNVDTSGSRASMMGRRATPSQSKVSESRAQRSVAASILNPDTPISQPQQEHEWEVESSPQPSPSPSLIPSPSVHPIDTLSKKLRQQAEELTRVYEQLETQHERLASVKSKSQTQKLEIERLKLALKQQRASSSRVVTSSAPATRPKPSVTKATLACKVKEAEEEKERYAVAAKHLEAIIDDAQRYFHDRGLDDSDGSETRATLEDQRVYIRVLEEVVHLKASEFNVSSHEELLVVLGELRHTIYEQEKAMEQQTQRIRDAETQLLEEKQSHLQVREQLDQQRRESADLGSSARAHESEMRQQILSVQREVQQHREQLEHATATCARLRERERDLEKRLARESDELEVTRARLELSASSGDEVSEKLSRATAEADDAMRQAKHWEMEAARRQTHLDEMNALQEELLDSIAKASAGQERASERVKELEQELRECMQREKETTSKLEELLGRTDSERRQLKQRLDELKLLNEQMDAECSSLREQTQELDEALEETQRQLQELGDRADDAQQQLEVREKEGAGYREAAAQLEAALAAVLQVIVASGAGANEVEGDSDDRMMDATAAEAIRVCCAALGDVLSSDEEAASPLVDVMVPSLRELLLRLKLSGSRLVSEMEECRESWARERRDLREACATLEEANQTCQFEVEQRHRQLLDCQRALADRGFQVEVMAIQSQALADQFAALQVVFEEKRVLEQHVDELESEVECSKTAITALESELYSRQREKETLAAELEYLKKQLEHQSELLGELYELRQRVSVLTTELNDALALSEEQNEWNQQLVSESERQEQAAVTHNALIRELEARERAFTRRFTQLFEQFAVDSELRWDQEWMAAGGDDYGAVLKRLQAFPMVVEQYITRSSALGYSGHIQTTVDDGVDSEDWRCKSSTRRRSGAGRLSFEARTRLQESDGASDKLEEQLELIRAAFQATRKESTPSAG